MRKNHAPIKTVKYVIHRVMRIGCVVDRDVWKIRCQQVAKTKKRGWSKRPRFVKNNGSKAYSVHSW